MHGVAKIGKYFISQIIMSFDDTILKLILSFQKHCIHRIQVMAAVESPN